MAFFHSAHQPRDKQEISIGFTIGAVFGGVVSAWLIPNYGWQAVFVVGGAMPLVLTVVMWRRLPESIPFLVLNEKGHDQIAALLRRVTPGSAESSAPDATYVVTEESRSGVPIKHLFAAGRGTATARLWTINFMNLLLAYFLSSWLTTIVRDFGYATSTTVLISAMMQLGGVAGTLVLVWLISRQGFRPILTASFVLAAAAIAVVGQAGSSFGLLVLAVIVAGGCVIGGQPALNALAGTYSPTYLRATAIGWALGVGRSGAIVGPVIASELIRRQWSPGDLFLAATVPALVSAGLLFTWRATPQDRT